MDTDLKMKNLEKETYLQKTKDEFLSYDLNLNQDKIKVYSLEDEFIKSKKNRYIIFILLVSGFLITVLLSGVIAHMVMREKERNVEVEIVEFEDLKLQELVFSVGSEDNKLKTVQLELEEIEYEHAVKIADLKAENSRLHAEILATAYSEAQQKEQLEQLNEALSNQSMALEAPYEKLRQAKLAELQVIEKNIASNQTKIAQHQGSNWTFQNPEQTLYELKIKALRAQYEKKIKGMRKKHQQDKQALIFKYNPEFKEKTIQSLLQKPAVLINDPKPFFSKNQNYLINAQLISKAELDKLKKISQNQLQLIAQLKTIPFQNSPQRTILHLDSMSKSLLNNYDETTSKLIRRIQTQIAENDQYKHFLKHIIQETAENGFITDPRNEQNIGVFLDNAYQIKEGDTGMVFRRDDEFIGVISFFQSEGNIKAKIKEPVKNKSLQPFDKILLNNSEAKQ